MLIGNVNILKAYGVQAFLFLYGALKTLNLLDRYIGKSKLILIFVCLLKYDFKVKKKQYSLLY